MDFLNNLLEPNKPNFEENYISFSERQNLYRTHKKYLTIIKSKSSMRSYDKFKNFEKLHRFMQKSRKNCWQEDHPIEDFFATYLITFSDYLDSEIKNPAEKEQYEDSLAFLVNLEISPDEEYDENYINSYIKNATKGYRRKDIPFMKIIKILSNCLKFKIDHNDFILHNRQDYIMFNI